jgi:bifunctional oligoribonuclease and PAP phosphatase NrnA
MKLNQNDVKEIFEIIDKSNDICIAGHKGPDGDCIGSVMALYELLKPTKKKLLFVLMVQFHTIINRL